MRHISRRLFVGAVAGAALAGGGAVTLAQTQGGSAASIVQAQPQGLLDGRGFLGSDGHGFPGGPGLGHFGHDLTAVTSYLGLTAEQLHSEREAGKSLAQIAQAQGKSVEGLKQAIVDASKKRLDQAVADGQLTSAQAAALLARLQSDVDDLVNRTGEPDGHGFRGSWADSAFRADSSRP